MRVCRKPRKNTSSGITVKKRLHANIKGVIARNFTSGFTPSSIPGVKNNIGRINHRINPVLERNAFLSSIRDLIFFVKKANKSSPAKGMEKLRVIPNGACALPITCCSKRTVSGNPGKSLKIIAKKYRPKITSIAIFGRRRSNSLLRRRINGIKINTAPIGVT